MKAHLRQIEPADYEWLIAQHGLIYTEEYGWDASFEKLVADICAELLLRQSAPHERGWIAELNGARVGSIHCARKDDETAKLRLLIVTAAARGYGVGGLLVDTCMSFAREAGYRRMTLWTNDVLLAARGLYASRGWALTASEHVTQFGTRMNSETWEVVL